MIALVAAWNISVAPVDHAAAWIIAHGKTDEPDSEFFLAPEDSRPETSLIT